jgi:hypothetical protein
MHAELLAGRHSDVACGVLEVPRSRQMRNSAYVEKFPIAALRGATDLFEVASFVIADQMA